MSVKRPLLKRRLLLIGLALLPVMLRAQSVTLLPAASPTTGQPGVTVVSVTGSGFPAGTINASDVLCAIEPATAGAGPGATAVPTSITTVVGTTRRVSFLLPASLVVTTPTAYRVTLAGKTSTGTTFTSSNSSALTINPPPVEISLKPASGRTGLSQAIVVSGVLTNFLQGATLARFGEGVSVGGGPVGDFGPVIVINRTTALAVIQVGGAATPGQRTVTVRTGTDDKNALGWEVVNTGTPAPSVFTLDTPPSPPEAAPGTEVTFQARNFPDDTFTAAQFHALFTPKNLAGGLSFTAAVKSLSASIGGNRTVIVEVPTTINLAFNTVYLVRIYGSSSNFGELATGSTVASSSTSELLLLPGARLISIAPDNAAPGAALNATVTGQGTAFTQAGTQVNFGPGISVGGAAPGAFGPVNVTSATAATAALTIAANAATGPRLVQARTGTQIVSLPSGFTVQVVAPPAVISSVTPNTGAQGATVDVTVTGQNTTFGASTVFGFGAGITVTNVLISNLTSATMRLTIAAGAALGPRTATATTGAQVATLVNAFTVTAAQPPPTIVSVVPSSGTAGTAVDVSVTGQNTSFGATTVFSFGPGINVGNVVVATATSAAMRLTIDAGTALGARTVTATTGSQVATLTNAFTVTAASAPVISAVVPNSGSPGATVDVTVSGQNTSFGNTTVFSFGLDISVSNVVVASVTSATMRLTIAANAAAGPRTVIATTGVIVASLANGFTVSGAVDTTPPTLSIVSPKAASTAFTGKPTFEVTYSDASGVNASTLTFKAGAVVLQFECDASAGGATCLPLNAFADGSVTVLVSVKDTSGNEAASSVQFVVDSAPVQILITAPANALITGQETIQVTGTKGANVNSVKVNDIAAVLSGNSFTASNIPLRGGVNMLVALATTANGKTGTATVDVTRDNIAPIVRIDSPTEGLTSIDNKITVTGLVNDIVSGGTEATVKVNGISASVGNGAFIVMNVPLVNGPNKIEAVATDVAGNVGKHLVNVTYQVPVSINVQPFSGDGQSATVKQTLPQPLVAIVKDTAGNPVAGRVLKFEVTRNSGTLRRIPADTPQRFLDIPTDGSGKASVLLTLGDTAGSGNNRVKVSGVGISGIFEFCASGLTAPPQKILMTMGDNQRGTINNPLATPLEALVADIDGNPVANVNVTFTVTRGSGNLTGQNSVVKKTGADGLVRAVLTLGADPGMNNNQVSATFPNLTTIPATFISSAIAPGNPANTQFSGVVLDNSHTPIPRTTVTIPVSPPISTLTDAQGRFVLTNVPVGFIHLRIDPSTTTRVGIFPALEFEYVTIAGILNNLGQPILIPQLESENTKTVGGPQDVVLTMKGVPGLQLKVFANSVTFGDGSKVGQVSINQVHLDKVPMAPPSGTFFMPPAWTIQPAGTKFNPPAQITIPNDGMPPGRVIDIFQFDHSLFTFINVGKGTTSADGLTITSDPGFGITAAGWGGCGQPQPPTTCAGSCDDGNRCTDDSCQNGSCVHAPKTEAQTIANGCKGCDSGTKKDPQTTAQCCADNSVSGSPVSDASTNGWVVCCNGSKTVCNKPYPATYAQNTVLSACDREHETQHFGDIDCPSGADECKTTRPSFKPGRTAADGECDAYKVTIACLKRHDCMGDAACQTAIDGYVAQYKTIANGMKAGCVP